MSYLYLLLLATVLASVVGNPAEKTKRQIPGGINERDPQDPKFLQLAQESFEKYKNDNPSGVVNVKEIKVTKASTQVVAGSISRIDFTVYSTNGEALNCHSQVLYPIGKKNKEITVTCTK